MTHRRLSPSTHATARSSTAFLGCLLLTTSVVVVGCGDDDTGPGGEGGSGASTASAGPTSGASVGATTTSTNTTTASSANTTANTNASSTTHTSTASTTVTAASTTGGMLCQPGAQQPCYGGPAGTDGVGACVAGVETCLPDGSGFGACVGEITPTFETCDVDADCDGVSAPACGAVYQKVYAGTLGAQYVTAVAVDTNGDVIVAGAFNRDIDVDGVVFLAPDLDEHVFLSKSDAAGNLLWVRRMPSNNVAQVTDIAIDDDGSIVLVGWFYSTFDAGGGEMSWESGADTGFIAKIDASGNHVFSAAYQGTSFWSVAIDDLGDIILGAVFTGPFDYGAGMVTSVGLQDGLLLKLDGDGAYLWSRQLGNFAEQALTAVDVDAAGDIYAAGWFAGTVDLGLGLRTADESDAFVVKLDATGAPIWDFVGGGANDQWAALMVRDSAGEVFVQGGFDGSADFGGGVLTQGSELLFKLDASGAHRWSKSFVESSDTYTGSLAIGPNDDVFWSGRYFGTIDFGDGPLPDNDAYDAWLAHFDGDGHLRSAQGYGTAEWQMCNALTVDAAGYAFLGCANAGTVDFGLGPLQAPSPGRVSAVVVSVLVQ